MGKKRQPREERKPRGQQQAADESLELDEELDGVEPIEDGTFLERMARSDEFVDHDGETCGMCHNMILGAQVAREMLAAGELEDAVSRWAAETQRRWRNSKFFRLWQQEQKAGRDPHQAFRDRGWEP